LPIEARFDSDPDYFEDFWEQFHREHPEQYKGGGSLGNLPHDPSTPMTCFLKSASAVRHNSNASTPRSRREDISDSRLVDGVCLIAEARIQPVVPADFLYPGPGPMAAGLGLSSGR
jgi:hypothetical protein